jgi:AraC family ethanolamine operon transcriptional activator
MTTINRQDDGRCTTQQRLLTLFDAEQLTQAVRGAEFEHKQLEPGEFRADLASAQTGEVITDSGRYNRTLRARGCLSRGMVTIGTVLEAESDGCINGFRFGPRDLIVYPAGAELDYVIPAGTHWVSVQIPPALLRELGIDDNWLDEPRAYAASLPTCVRVTRRLELIGIGGQGGSAGELRHHIRALGTDLARLSRGQTIGIGRPSYAERARQLRRFEELVRERMGERLRIAALCEDLGVAQRTLEQTFQDHLGLPPRRYLTILRLHAAREQLLRPGDRDIASIAGACGLMHPGRFSNEYRALFGESPSATRRA